MLQQDEDIADDRVSLWEGSLEIAGNSLDLVGPVVSRPWNVTYRQCSKCNRICGSNKLEVHSSARCTCVTASEDEGKSKTRFTCHQWLILIICMFANFGCAACVSLQAPFFPIEAEKKGFHASVYGFVLGCFSLTVFILAPIFGKYISVIGTYFMLNAGIFITSTCCILFGLLDRAEPTAFITLAFIVRIVEAIGEAGYTTACFTMIAKEFPNNIGTTFAIIRAAFGVGLILGPMVGEVLYGIDGYYLPFATMGSMLFVIAIATRIVFCNRTEDIPTKLNAQVNKHGILDVLRIPSVLLMTIVTCSGSMSVGFINVSLGVHLKNLGVKTLYIGVIFIINGGVFGLTSVLWGWLCDGKVRPKLLASIGFLLVSVNYLFLAPVPFLPMNAHVWMICMALAFHGLGVGGELLPLYVDAQNEAVINGFPDTSETHGLIGGLWSSTNQLGNFIGPSVGGLLIDHVHFPWATVVILGYQALMGCFTFAFYLVRKCKGLEEHTTQEERQRLINDNGNETRSHSINA